MQDAAHHGMAEDTMNDDALKRWERIMGYAFHQKELAALAALAAGSQRSGALMENRSLAFLGDAVLGLYAADEAFRTNPSGTHSEFTERRKTIVSNSKLAAVAKRHNLSPEMVPADAAARGNPSDNELATFVEALIGAVFADSKSYAEACNAFRRMRDGTA